MRILHTADWHLGKKLVRADRLAEQQSELTALENIVERENVDIVVIAGDIFDTFVPTAEAEILFYDKVVAISRHCPIVVIAGNHDDEDRLCAPDRIARSNGIIFTDGLNTNGLALTHSSGAKIYGENGCIKVEKAGEKLNLAVFPFPTTAKLLDLAKEKNYSEFVGEKLNELAQNFVKGEINALATHLFVLGANTSDERELGGSKIVPKTVFDLPYCNFVMLGHIHKPMTVSKTQNIYYSGSLLRYSFDDTTDKRVLIFDSDGENTTVNPVAITGGKRLITVEVDSKDDAVMALNEHIDDYVKILYRSAVPLTAKDMSEIRKIPSFVEISVIAEREQSERESNKGKSATELFEIFYQTMREGKKPSAELIDIYLKALNGELN
ncbi:MAG: exonuclease SbcCD subunit D [Clostridia bacterium]|nr:exonuclease SbcCD subunit D [Clostridia bacterium]